MDKIKGKLILGLIICILLVNIVKAEVIIDGQTGNTITFDVDYGSLRNNQRSMDLSKSITLKSNSGVAESVTFEKGLMNTGYDLTLDKSVATISSEGAVLNLNLHLPVDTGSNGIVGHLKVKYANGNEKVFDIDTKIVPMLDLKKIYVYVNDIEEKTVTDDGSMVKYIQPNDKIKLRFVLDNNFDSDYNYGNIDATVTIQNDDSDLGSDIDEEYDFSVDAGRKLDGLDEGIVEFTIPNKAKNGEYDLAIKVTGKDENKAKYVTNWKLTLKIERKDNDVKIESLTVSPLEVSCFRKVQVNAKVINDGAVLQKHVALSMVSDALGLNYNENFQLNRGTDDGNYAIKQTWIDLDKNLKPGTYTIYAKAFYDYTQLMDSRNVQVVVKDCATAKAEATQAAQNASVVNGTTTVNQAQGNLNTQGAKTNLDAGSVKAGISSEGDVPVIVQTRESSPYNADDYLLGIIIVAVIFVIALIVMCTAILMRN